MSVDRSIRFVNRPSGRTERVIPSVPSRASAVVHKGENRQRTDNRVEGYRDIGVAVRFRHVLGDAYAVMDIEGPCHRTRARIGAEGRSGIVYQDQIPIHSFLTILFSADIVDIAARYEVLGLSGYGTLNVWQSISPNSPLSLSSWELL